MARCTKIRRKKRRACVGDLTDLISIQNRNVTAPDFNSADFNADFSDEANVWAGINTVHGKTFFDGVSTEVNITHEILIHFDETVTSSSWVLFESRRFDILDTEDLDERHEYMILTCAETGKTSREGSKL